MSFKSVIEIDGQVFNILKFSHNFLQNIDASGKPNAIPQGGYIDLTIESSLESNVFMRWMIDSSATKTGVIKFTRNDNEGLLKTLEFTDAYCIGYDEIFFAKGSTTMTTHLTISALKLKCGEAKMEKDWYSSTRK